MTDGLTLQINLAASDRSYAKDVVPALAASHRAAASEIIVTIDFTKPQKTKLTDPAVRCREPEFTEQLEGLRALAESWQHDRLIDRIVCLRQDDPWLKEVTRKYSGRWLPETHDFGGRPITGYWAGIEAARTRFVVHYDGDMFLYQAPGFDWAAHAIPLLAKQDLALSASPRLTPPFASRTGYGDYASAHEGVWMYPVEGGWKQYFFSTRAFLVDREKLERYLPLGRGAILREQLLVKALRRGFPRSAEKMWWSTAGNAGAYRLILSTEQAWVLHPNWKPPEFAALVPAIIESVAANRVPDAQLGRTELDFKAWQDLMGTRL
ncbi:MAG: hypothetical protein ACXWIQ_18080 [Caldimonas sp.]